MSQSQNPASTSSDISHHTSISIHSSSSLPLSIPSPQNYKKEVHTSSDSSHASHEDNEDDANETSILANLTEKITELEGEIWHQFLATLKGYLHDKYEKRGIYDQLERDVKLWRDTFEASDEGNAPNASNSPGSTQRRRASSLTKRRLGILRRLFIVVRYSTVLFRAEKSVEWQKWSDEEWPIAALLSHGGRVIIQLPPAATLQEQHAFWTWLMTGDENGNLGECVSVRRTGEDAYEEGKVVFRRMGSTHSVASLRPSLVTTILSNVEQVAIPQKKGRSSSSSKKYEVLEHADKITVRDTSTLSSATSTNSSASSSGWSWMKNWIAPEAQKNTSTDSQEVTTEETVKQSAEGYLLTIPGTPFKKVVRETKTWGFSMRDSKYFSFNEEYILQHHRHWGMNIALGGDGNMSLSRKLIKANGSHGHVYFYYQSPDVDRYGAIMVGVEGSEYGHYDVTGCYHGLSAKSAPFGPTFGYKWHAKHEPSLRKHKGPDKYNSMLIDLTSTGWKHLKEKAWRADIPGETCEA